MKDYHDSYLKCSILLIADVFEQIRYNSIRNYGLCLSHYFRAPALSWDVMLNMTKMKPELITDPDMFIVFERGVRSGVSYRYRYSKANNRYLKSYDPKQESKQIIYLDTNDLYGYVMSKFLPIVDSNG